MTQAKHTRRNLLQFAKDFGHDFVEKKSSLIVLILLCFACLYTAYDKYTDGNTARLGTAFVTLFLLFCPAFFQTLWNIRIPAPLEVLILCFIFASAAMGSIFGFYARFSWWDIFLHTASGVLIAAGAFPIYRLLHRDSSEPPSPLFCAILALCIAVTLGVCWEFCEYIGDILFQGDSQRDTVIHSFRSYFLQNPDGSTPGLVDEIYEVTINGEPLGVGGYIDIGLLDTMKDLFYNTVGALAFCVLAIPYAKNVRCFSFLRYFIPTARNRKGQ